MTIISTTRSRTESVETIPFDDAIESPALQQTSVPLTLTKHSLIDLWESGILPPTAYVHLALQYELMQTGEVEYQLDIENFIHNWRGTLDPDSGKVKELKRKQVAMAVFTLEEKGLIGVTKEQLTLDLGV